MSNERPYIGITGVAVVQDAEWLAREFNSRFIQLTSHTAMAGYLLSERSIRTNSNRYLQLPDLLRATASSALNTIHFNPESTDSFLGDVLKIFQGRSIYRDNLCRTLQINGSSWPDYSQLQRLKDVLPELKMIIQINQNLMIDSPEQTANELMKYQQLMDFILLDPSGGTGKEFDSSLLIPYFKNLRQSFPYHPIIFAGGFGDNNTRLRLDRLSTEARTKEFGTDAQSKLIIHPKASAPQLNRDLVQRYLDSSCSFFSDMMSQP